MRIHSFGTAMRMLLAVQLTCPVLPRFDHFSAGQSADPSQALAAPMISARAEMLAAHSPQAEICQLAAQQLRVIDNFAAELQQNDWAPVMYQALVRAAPPNE